MCHDLSWGLNPQPMRTEPAIFNCTGQWSNSLSHQARACKHLFNMPGILFICLGHGVYIIKHLYRMYVKCENKKSFIKLKAYREILKLTSLEEDNMKKMKH